MADDLADRISDGHVAVLELVPGEQRFIDLSRFVLRGGASRFAGVVLNDEPIRYVLPVGVPSRTTLDYGVLLIQRSRCALVWRTDPMKPSHALIAELGPDTTVQHAPVVVRGEMWGRFDLRHAGSTPMTFLVPPVDSPALPQMLHRVLVLEPRSRQGHVDAEPLAVEVTEGIPMIPPVDAAPPAPAPAPADERTEVLEAVPDVERTVPQPAFRSPGATAAPRPSSDAPRPAPFAPPASDAATPLPSPDAAFAQPTPFAPPAQPAPVAQPTPYAPPAAGAPTTTTSPAPAAPPAGDQGLFRAEERRAPGYRPPVPAPPRPVTPASATPAAAQVPAAPPAENPWEVKRRRGNPAPGFAPGTAGPSTGAQRPNVVAVPPTAPAPTATGAPQAPRASGLPATQGPAPVTRQGLPDWASGFLTGLIVTLVLGGILVFAKWMGWLG